MAVYRFRVTFESDEDVYREIDIQSVQNFEELHKIILKSVGFENNADASFFISDDYWRKGDEIALTPANENDKPKKNRPEGEKKYLMNKSKLASLIDDPHQKFIYINDPKSPTSFLVELIKILPDDKKATYPKCSKSEGIAPKKDNTIIIPPDILDELDMDEDDHHVDDEAYLNAHDESDIDGLEGEEKDDTLEDELDLGEEVEEEMDEFGEADEAHDDDL